MALVLCVGCHQSKTPPVAQPPPQVVSVELGKVDQEYGLQLRLNNDGEAEPAIMDGSECRVVRRQRGMNVYFYFAVGAAFKWAESMDVAIAVEYFDSAPGYFILQYDASNTNNDRTWIYANATENERPTGNGGWKKAYFIAKGASFRNSQNAQSDFRVEVHAQELYVRQVSVIRLAPDEATSRGKQLPGK